MKRYNTEYVGDCMDESHDGEWVKWNDVVECNCEYNVERLKYYDGDDTWWICPAHGYKKL